MKMPRSAFAWLSCVSCLSSLGGSIAPLAIAAAPIAVAATVAGCADEADPKTWVKRLDDQVQRTTAIKRIDEMFNGAMRNASNNRDDAKVKAVVDDTVEALAKTYTAGGLDEKTRKDLIKLIADMGDPRGAPAFAKAFKDFEPGKGDEDVKFAAQGTSRLSTAGKLTDQALIDALWDCFAKFQPSKTKSSALVQDLASAIKTVKHPSWGPKAVAMISQPVTPENQLDQLEFWQITAVQLIGDTKFTAGVNPLVKMLLTPSKLKLTGTVRLALHKMAKESEPELIKGLKGEGDYAKLAEAYPDQAYVPLMAEPLAYMSRPAGLAAILDALQNAKNDQNRVMLASYLTFFPFDAKLVKAYVDAYGKVSNDAVIAMRNGSNGRAELAAASANFFDAGMTDWLLKEIAGAKGEAALTLPTKGLRAATKLMTPEQAKGVGEAVNKIAGQATEKDEFKSANAIVEKCKKDAACYLAVLDTPVPSAPPTAKMGHVKAAWMQVVLKNESAKPKLLERIEKVKDISVRQSMLEAYDALSPKGDPAAAEKLEKLVESETAAGNKGGLDEMYRIAQKLRSRAL